MCARCRRPEGVCYCAHVPRIETASRVVILQHPRERTVPIGTARMASLCLPGAELHVGIHWSGTPALERALSDPARPAALLYPGPGAIDVLREPPPGPITLIVVDGTWSQTRKVVRRNPELAALPRYAFSPPTPSEYRIRKEPDDVCVSTIEAIAHVLGALGGDPERCLEMLRPFRAMVDAQLACAKSVHHGRGRKKRAPRPPRPVVPAWMVERASDLVCVVGEANAWPYRSVERETEHPDELVHWVAQRLSTGEQMELVIAPRNPLSSRTPVHLGLDEEALRAGATVADALARWRAFVRDSDVVCAWGQYGTGLFEEMGGHLPAARLDVRQLARDASGGKVGMAEDYLARLGLAAAPPVGSGRAGLRLGQLTAIVRGLLGLEDRRRGILPPTP